MAIIITASPDTNGVALAHADTAKPIIIITERASATHFAWRTSLSVLSALAAAGHRPSSRFLSRLTQQQSAMPQDRRHPATEKYTERVAASQTLRTGPPNKALFFYDCRAQRSEIAEHWHTDRRNSMKDWPFVGPSYPLSISSSISLVAIGNHSVQSQARGSWKVQLERSTCARPISRLARNFRSHFPCTCYGYVVWVRGHGRQPMWAEQGVLCTAKKKVFFGWTQHPLDLLTITSQRHDLWQWCNGKAIEALAGHRPTARWLCLRKLVFVRLPLLP